MGRGITQVGRVAVLAVVAAFVAPTAARGVDPAPPELVVPGGIRLLVVAPHPDDESLGAGGLMQKVRAAGGEVRVLFMTNGDGYPEALEAATGDTEPTAVDYRGFGELRSAEALVALEQYRVFPPAVTFLGFPDGGLAEILRRGPARAAYQSPYTREDNPPYPDALEVKARYVQQDLVHLVARTLARIEPDWIALPTPLDTHGDHCATYAFVAAALAARASGQVGRPLPADRTPRLLTYLVHTGNWPPAPSVAGPLPLPRETFAPARWFSLPLGEAEVATKLSALRTHRTQAAVMESLFRSFARSNELFGVIEPAAVRALDPAAARCALPVPPGVRPPPAPVAPPAHAADARTTVTR